ncbi:LptF/LptG family permease [Roseimaritima multifibrata]|nr:LptF/LptG family permease [Roseimaritima multifibrata]
MTRLNDLGMPTRLTRYILFEIIRIFSVALVALTMLILVIGVARQLIREGMGPMAVLELLPYVLPISLQFALPATALFAVCCVYGKMAADGEVSTVKAIGVSPVQLMKPAFIFAALLSPAAVWLGDVAVSWGEPGVRRVALHSLEEITYRVLNAEHSYTRDKVFSISVCGVNGKILEGPTVTLYGSGSSAPTQIMAREGQLELDPERMALILRVTDSQLIGGNSFRGEFEGEDVIEISLDGAVLKEGGSDASPSHLPLNRMRKEAIKTEKQVEEDRGKLAAQVGFSLLTSRWDEIARDPVQPLEGRIHGGSYRLIRLRTEPWRRWAGGFSCLCFVIVGAPLGMIARTADYWTTFGMCFLPILLLYYPLFIFGLDEAKDGNLPPYAVWLGNVVLLGVGLLLIQRVRRH